MEKLTRAALPFVYFLILSFVPLASAQKKPLAVQTCNCSPTITSPAGITFTQGQLGSFTVTTTGIPTPSVSWGGVLPTGITLSGNVLSGTPSVAGTFKITFMAANGNLPNAQQAFTLTVLPTVVTPPPGAWWKPGVVLEWNWQLSSSPSASQLLPSPGSPYPVYDIDGEDASAGTVAALHQAGAHAICYISAGTWENWRSDQASFPAAVKGSGNGWPGEKWLDIRAITTLQPIMAKRVANCAAKGFDAMEFDNIDGYSNRTGFPLTAADQLAYNKMLAGLAHDAGLAAGLKNDGDQVKQLLPYFDFDINEQCVQYSECGNLTPFVQAGKPVFEAEYSGNKTSVCGALNALNMNGIMKTEDLKAAVTQCR